MKSLSYLNKYLFKYKWRFLLGIVFIFGSNWFKVEMPEFFGDFTDELINWDNSQSTNTILYTAIKAGGIIMGLIMISGFFLFLTRHMIITMSRFIEFDLKNEIYRKYQKLNYSFYKKNNTGDLMNRISEDVTKVRMYLGPGIMYSINLIALSILVIKNMVNINSLLTLIVLIPLPIMSFIIYKVTNRIGNLSLDVQKEQSDMSTLVQESFSGIRIIKVFNKKNEMEKKFNQSTEEYKRKTMKLVLTNALFLPTIFILIGISTILCIYLGGLFHYNDKITQGEILKYIFYVNHLTWPFASIGWVSSLTSRAAASQTRINYFLNEKAEIIDSKNKSFKFDGNIEFIDVSYTYPDSNITAIKNLNLKIKKGESLGIIGKTGTGKSTIIKLLMRQIEPTSGRIIINGINLKEINLNQFRDQSGLVPQDTFLFSDSIKNNILFGLKKKNSKKADIEKVAKETHIHHNVIEFNNKYDTILGERGVNLSGGQKQRISIARALIRNPKLLILDDSFSSLDTETEDIILSNLKKRTSTTFIIISHRISSLRNMSKIISIKNGRITEEGNHEELIKLDGMYANLYKKQLNKN